MSSFEFLEFPVDRPSGSDWPGTTVRVPVPMPNTDEADAPLVGAMYVTLSAPPGWDRDYPLEVFATVGKQGGDASLLTDTICRLISGWLQWGAPVERVLKHLENMSGAFHVSWAQEQGLVKSIPDGIAKAIMRYQRRCREDAEQEAATADKALAAKHSELDDAVEVAYKSAVHKLREEDPAAEPRMSLEDVRTAVEAAQSQQDAGGYGTGFLASILAALLPGSPVPAGGDAPGMPVRKACGGGEVEDSVAGKVISLRPDLPSEHDTPDIIDSE